MMSSASPSGLLTLAVVLAVGACRSGSTPASAGPTSADAPTAAADTAPPSPTDGQPAAAATSSGLRPSWVAGHDVATLELAMERLRPLHNKLGKPRPGDWLAEHHESGQSFEQYLRSDPVLPSAKRRLLYVQPLGELGRNQRRIIELSAEYMGLFFNLEVQVQPDLPASVIPAKARRVHPSWGDEQILSTYVLSRVLKPRLPQDAAAYIAFTATDLWPGRGWNFVFGQASLSERVGVWSIYRKGDPDESPESFRLTLRRTLKTAVHETGHMFSMEHCTAHECVMCGSNSLAESDRRPLWLGPECMAKVCWAMKIDPVARYRSLAEFASRQGLKAEHAFFLRSIEALGGRAR